MAEIAGPVELESRGAGRLRSVRAQEAFALEDLANERAERVAFVCGLLDDGVHRERVAGTELPGGGVAEEVGGEGARKAMFLLQERFLEAHRSVELVFFEEHAGSVDFASVRILVPPAADDVVVLEGESEWIEARVAAGAVGVLAVLGELLADGEVLGGGVFVQGWDVVGRRWRWVVEDDFNDPGAACNGVRFSWGRRSC